MKYINKLELKVRRQKLPETILPYLNPISEPTDASNAAKSLLDGEGQEIVLVFNLDAKNKILGYVEVARGSLDTCSVDPRVLFRTAIYQGAVSIIIMHNHPAGGSTPSQEDIQLTKRLQKGGEILGIFILDHLIVTGDDYYSFAKEGLL